MPAPAQIVPADARSRRQHIAWLAGGLVLVALVVAWLEAGASIVVYNNTEGTLANLQVMVGKTPWDVGPLAPGESRRWQPPAGVAGELSVSAEGWDAARPPVLLFDPRQTSRVVLRFGPLQTITTTAERDWWRSLLNW